MSGRLAERISAGIARGVRRFSPARPRTAPTRLWVRLSNYAGSLFRPRLLFDHPRLALGDQRLEVGGLARGGSPVLLDYRGFEGRPRVFVNDAERHREVFVL